MSSGTLNLNSVNQFLLCRDSIGGRQYEAGPLVGVDFIQSIDHVGSVIEGTSGLKKTRAMEGSQTKHVEEENGVGPVNTVSCERR